MKNDNEKLLKDFKKVIDQRSLSSMNLFLYTFFTSHCSFIAHYNVYGFKSYYSGQNFLEFLDQFTNPPYYLFFNNKHEDLIREMIDYAKQNESAILFEFENQGLNSKLKMLQQLANELGYEIQQNSKKAIPLSINANGQFALL